MKQKTNFSSRLLLVNQTAGKRTILENVFMSYHECEIDYYT